MRAFVGIYRRAYLRVGALLCRFGWHEPILIETDRLYTSVSKCGGSMTVGRGRYICKRCRVER